MEKYRILVIISVFYKKESQGYTFPMTFPNRFLSFQDALVYGKFAVPIVLIPTSYKRWWTGRQGSYRPMASSVFCNQAYIRVSSLSVGLGPKVIWGFQPG